MSTKYLTKAEEQVMQVLWRLEKAFLRDIVASMPQPRPHQNTVATLLRILTEKEFVGVTVQGRQHEYYPRISRNEYARKSIRRIVKGYFEGSVYNFLSFLISENNLTAEELDQALHLIKKQQKSAR